MAYIGRDIEQGLFTKQTFTADSSTTVFTLSHAVVSANNLLVSVGGVIQEPDSAYTASGTVLTFTGTPTTGDLIWVVYLGKSGSSSTTRGAIVKQTGVGDGTTTPITLSTSAVNSASIIVTLNGVVQVPDTDFVASGTTLTFTTAPSAALAILVYFLSAKARLGKPAAGSVTTATLASSGTLPAVNGSALTGVLSHADLNVLRTNMSLAGFNRSTDHATTVLGMPNGFIDQFEDQTGVDDPSSTNELYDTTGDYYSPSAATYLPSTKFDGTNDYLNRSSSLTGSTSSGKELLFATWYKSEDATLDQFVVNANANIGIYKNSAGKIGIELTSSSGATHYAAVTTQNAVITQNQFHHIIVSVNLATPTVQFVVDGVLQSNTNFTAPTVNNIVYSTNWHFARWLSSAHHLKGSLGQFYFDDKFIDMTVAANRQKFYNNGPVDLGANGSTPSGSQPLIYLNNPFGTFQNNLGSGGTITENGALTQGTNINITLNNMTLVSETSTASASPDNAHIALFNEEVDALTLDTDIMAWASRSKQTVTATNATNVLNATAHGLSNGDRVMLTTTATDLPAGLTSEPVYYVVNKTTNTFQVSATSGGSAVAFTDDGTGTHSVRVVTKAALVDRGDFETGKATLSALVDISGQPTDTDMSLIVQTKNNKETKLHGMSMQYT